MNPHLNSSWKTYSLPQQQVVLQRLLLSLLIPLKLDYKSRVKMLIQVWSQNIKDLWEQWRPLLVRKVQWLSIMVWLQVYKDKSYSQVSELVCISQLETWLLESSNQVKIQHLKLKFWQVFAQELLVFQSQTQLMLWK